MPIEVTCQCGRKTSVPEKYAGKKGRCPTCGNVMLIPLDSGSMDSIPDFGAEIGPDESAEISTRSPSVPSRFSVAPNPVSIAPTHSPSFYPPAAEGQEENVTPIEVKPSVPASISPPPSPYRPSVPPEPWYYGWLDGLAGVVWLFSKVILIIVVIIACVAGVLSFIASRDPASSILVVAVPILIVAASLLSSFIGSALLMLVVDVARNIREVRYR